MTSYFDNFGKDYVDSMNNAIGTAEVKPTNGYVTPPDGKYQMRVQSLEVKESNYNDGYPNFILQLTIIEGEHRGKSVYKRYPLDPSQSMNILKSDLFLLGVDFRSIYDLENREKMSSLLEHVVEVTIKSKVSSANGKTYANFYLNRDLGKHNPQANSGSGFTESDDDMPWGK